MNSRLLIRHLAKVRDGHVAGTASGYHQCPRFETNINSKGRFLPADSTRLPIVSSGEFDGSPLLGQLAANKAMTVTSSYTLSLHADSKRSAMDVAETAVIGSCPGWYDAID
jgi:hypothetical protein